MLLYQLRDLQLAALAPWHFAALAAENILRAPFCLASRTPWGQEMAAQAALWQRMTRFYANPSFNIGTSKFRGEPIEIRERLIDQTPFCRLIGFVRASSNPVVEDRAQGDPRILILAPLSGHFASLLRDTVEALLPSHNVLITDWIDARMVPLSSGSFGFDDQIELFTETIRKLGDNLHLVAIGQSCAPALAAVALLAEAETPVEPRSLTLIGGPVDTQITPSALSQVALSHPLSWFQETRIQLVPPYYPGAFRAVYPGFLQLHNRMALTTGKAFTEQARYFEHLSSGCEETGERRERLYDAFLSTLDVPAELYLDYVKKLYQENALARGELRWRERRVNTEAIRHTALLTIEGEMDDLSPPGQTRAAHRLCPNIPDKMKQSHLEIGAGTFGVFTGRKWRNTIEPVLHKFVRKHSLAAQEVENAIG